MTLSSGQTATGPLLSVAGDLDHRSAGVFRAAVNALALLPGQLLTVDLSALAFCDSSGITALISGRNNARAAGADVALVRVPPSTVRILRILGLDQVFRVDPAPAPGSAPDPDPV
ncbi:STAS domain-containing protein [Actinacidiphila paucisporea]|nr:STAS domain-containing protein [Actinacidiphila paucisporea]